MSTCKSMCLISGHKRQTAACWFGLVCGLRAGPVGAEQVARSVCPEFESGEGGWRGDRVMDKSSDKHSEIVRTACHRITGCIKQPPEHCAGTLPSSAYDP